MNTENKLTERELNIRNKIISYLSEIEKENSILQGDLLLDEEKQFIKNDPNAFIMGLISDQSVKAELAWSLPYNLYKRLGTFDLNKILQEYSLSDIEEQIKNKPSLHRYPSRIATYIYSAINDLIREYNGNAENIWKGKSALQIVASLEKFKGISHKKASLGTLILVRDLGIEISDKENIDIAYDIHIRRLFTRLSLVDEDTQENVLEAAKKLYPEFPGKLTTAFWTLGREFCRPTDPSCLICPLYEDCSCMNQKVR